MRDVVLYTLLSLDGVAEEPGDWLFDADDELFTNLADVIRSQDDVLLGRGTYDYWAGYWPTSDVQPFADFINRTTKHVFTSSTPTRRGCTGPSSMSPSCRTSSDSSRGRVATSGCTGASGSRRACWPPTSSTGSSSSSLPRSPGRAVACSPTTPTFGA